MEIALEPEIPTYSGGLGVLAGDTIRSAADLGLDFTGVSLLHRRGFFRQSLGERGEQIEAPDPWRPEDRLEPMAPRVSIEIESRKVEIRAWRYSVLGQEGATVPVYLLDTDLPENHPDDRHLTDDLYLGDMRHRLRQEVVLGVGGLELLEALGERPFDRFHLNEGHAALAPLALVERFLAQPSERPSAQPSQSPSQPPSEQPSELPSEALALAEALRLTRALCVFTTHTPVPAGHDRFPLELARSVLGDRRVEILGDLGLTSELNMTELALVTSRYVNGVAIRHGEVSRSLFPGYPIRSITNGVHARTWVSPAMHDLFDRHIPAWPNDPFALRYAGRIPTGQIAEAHRRSKEALLDRVRALTGRSLDPDALTLGFARRATGYKRTALVFRDLERLEVIASRHGPMQIVFAGKAHPRDEEGKDSIRQVFAAAESLRGRIEVVYLADYDMDLGQLLVSGSDVWLNNPIPPLEASGTSGMKAALNGVPSLSILDGWWVEGCVEGVTGWEIEDGVVEDPREPHARDAHHADALLRKLDEQVAPLFFGDRERFLDIRRQSIALNGSFFNTHRMLLQYLYEAYLSG